MKLTTTDFARYMSIAFLFLVALGSAVLAFIDLSTGHDIPVVIVSILSSAIGYAFSTLGIHNGVNILNGKNGNDNTSNS